jgi:hypothetical protein
MDLSHSMTSSESSTWLRMGPQMTMMMETREMKKEGTQFRAEAQKRTKMISEIVTRYICIS